MKRYIKSETQIPNIPKMTVTEFLNEFDFDYEVVQSEEFDGPCWKLTDLQYANLGNIEEEEFFDIVSIVDRLETYYDDYILEVGATSDDYNVLLEEVIKEDPNDWRIPIIYYILHPNELIVDKPLSK